MTTCTDSWRSYSFFPWVYWMEIGNLFYVDILCSLFWLFSLVCYFVFFFLHLSRNAETRSQPVKAWKKWRISVYAVLSFCVRSSVKRSSNFLLLFYVLLFCVLLSVFFCACFQCACFLCAFFLYFSTFSTFLCLLVFWICSEVFQEELQ